MSSSGQWFDISNDGWRRMNAGRPPYELIKELIQNILDEDFNKAYLNYGMQGEDFVVTVEDDVENGIIDSALITTVFLTGKEESHLKRGRKGRGLKEFLSVCYKATVETVGKTINFCENGNRVESVNNRNCGTRLIAYIREDGWNKKAIKAIDQYVHNIILYNGNEFLVNGKPILKRIPEKTIKALLLTQIIDDGIQKDVSFETTIDVYTRNKNNKGLLFEMGIPVVETDIPFNIDIHQRIPMNDNRNDVSSDYINKLKIKVVPEILSLLNKKDLLGWALNVSSYIWDFPFSIREDIVKKIIGENNLFHIVLSSKKIYDDKARQKGKEVFNISGMSHDIRSLLGNVISTSEYAIKDMERNSKPITVEFTEEEKSFCNIHREIVKKAVGIDVDFTVIEKEKDTEGNWTRAFHIEHRISYNRLAIKKTFFNNAYSEEAIDLLIHELAHEKEKNHSEKKYINAVTKFGAKIAVYFMRKSVDKKPVKSIKRVNGFTVKDSLKKVLEVQGMNYMSLSDIYAGMGAVTVGEKAGIRGVLNRECMQGDGIFERSPQSGSYRLRIA